MDGFNREKFTQMVHYICHRADPDKLGAIRLNKILYFADSLHYLHSGVTMSGESYVKQQFGPVPKHILHVLEHLKRNNLVQADDSSMGPFRMRLFRSQQDPDTSQLKGAELEFLDQMTDVITKRFTAMGISEATHDRIWALASKGEEIPFETVFVSQQAEITPEDMAWALDSIRKMDEQVA